MSPDERGSQEYGSDCPEPNKNRVYISYLDSVRYFESEPASHRSTMYHAILVAYLQWARMLGFKHVHIWVEPPKMGDEYIFFARSRNWSQSSGRISSFCSAAAMS